MNLVPGMEYYSREAFVINRRAKSYMKVGEKALVSIKTSLYNQGQIHRRTESSRGGI
jgi:hypothetical protein